MYLGCTRVSMDYWGGSKGGKLPPLNGGVWEGYHPPVTVCTFGLCWPTWDVQWLRRVLANNCLFHIHTFMCRYTNYILIIVLILLYEVRHSISVYILRHAPQPYALEHHINYYLVDNPYPFNKYYTILLKLKYSNRTRTLSYLYIDSVLFCSCTRHSLILFCHNGHLPTGKAPSLSHVRSMASEINCYQITTTLRHPEHITPTPIIKNI